MNHDKKKIKISHKMVTIIDYLFYYCSCYVKPCNINLSVFHVFTHDALERNIQNLKQLKSVMNPWNQEW